MTRSKLFVRVLSCVMILIIGIGVVCGYIQPSNASEKNISEQRVKADYVGTETLNKYLDTMQDMTVEEFESVFLTEEYQKDFYNTYEKVKRGDNKLVNLLTKMKNLKDEQIDKIAVMVLQRIPQSVREKYEITEESISKPLKWISSQLVNGQSITTTSLSVLLKAFTGFPRIISKPIFDIIYNVIEKVVNNIIDKDEPSIEPTENPMCDDILNCPPQMDTTAEPFLEDCPPRPDVTEQPQETEVPASEPQVTEEPAA